jgi:hypothetical protein
MSYCPKCRHEYSETVEVCIECGSKLRRGRRPIDTSIGVEDSLVPIGAAICGIIAMVMLYLRIGSQFGWISGPLAALVQATQPPCMTAFYGIAFVACCLVLAVWTVQTLIRRR